MQIIDDTKLSRKIKQGDIIVIPHKSIEKHKEELKDFNNGAGISPQYYMIFKLNDTYVLGNIEKGIINNHGFTSLENIASFVKDNGLTVAFLDNAVLSLS